MKIRERLDKKTFSDEHIKYLNNQKRHFFKVKFFQIGIIILFFVLWEFFARFKLIDPFITSSPFRIWNMLISLNHSGELWMNIYYTTFETIVGFLLGTLMGVILAALIWFSDFVYKVIEPYLVVLNALPKVALGPIIIVWLGSGMSAIVVMTLLVSVIISVINILVGFKSVSEEKVLLMKSFGASKLQILLKLIIPANISVILSTLKINVGMSLIGVITGEFLVSSQGIGYLIVYGGQVFKLDLVMAGILILLVVASIMYLCVSNIEKLYLKRKR
ncbi:MAG: ABC transporter permease [Clostridia bacterium]|nr:ABC transporter permease [Clostridia bacterium]